MSQPQQAEPTVSRDRWPTRFAWALWVLSIALLVALVVLNRANDASGRLPPDADTGFSGGAGELLWLASFTTLGALVAARRPRNLVGWLLLALGLAFIGLGVTGAYSAYGLVAAPDRVPAVTVVAWLHNATFAWPIVLVAVLLMVFPEGRLPSGRARWLLWALLGASVLRVSAEWFTPGVLPWFQPESGESTFPVDVQVRNPFGILPISEALAETLLLAGAAGTFALTAVAALRVLLRFRRARGAERQQLKWLALGAGVSSAGLVLGTVLWDRLDDLGSTVQIMPIVAIPITMAIAILRHQLWDIDRLLNRTLVYALVTLVLGAGYAGGVLGLAALLGRDRSALAVAATTLAAAAAFQPVRRRSQDLVDRRFNRRRYDAARTIDGFTARLRQQTDLDALTAELLAVVDQTMQPTHTALWLRPASRGSSPEGGSR